MKSRFTLLLILATALTFAISFGCKKEEAAKTDEAPAAGAASTPAAGEMKDEAPAAGEEKKMDEGDKKMDEGEKKE